jgi:hypothetical protein
MMLWEDNSKRKNVQEIITYLLELHVFLGQWRHDGIKSTIAFSELAASAKDGVLSRSLIMQILREMHENNKKTVEEFELLYEQKQEERLLASNSKADEWAFFIPIDINLASDIVGIPKFIILGKDFTLENWEVVDRQVDEATRRKLHTPEQLSEELNSINLFRSPNLYITVRGKGANAVNAWREIDPAFEALRGLLEFFLNRFQTTNTWIGERRPLRKIPHPQWMLAFKENVEPEWFRFVIDTENIVDPFPIKKSTLEKIQEFGQFLHNMPKPNSTLELITNCLRLYAQAMDARFEHLCFLGLWQLAEAITRSETIGGKTDDVVKRLAWHREQTDLAGSGFTETLNSFGKMRNQIVHKGIHLVDENDVNILKFICDLALYWLIGVHESLPTMVKSHYFCKNRLA